MAQSIPRPRAAATTLRRTVFSRPGGTLLAYALMLLAVAVISVPVVWMVLGSLKTRQEIISTPIHWLPGTLRWQNFRNAWETAPFDRFYINSLVVTSAGAGLKVVNGILTAYALVFLRFPKKNVVFIAVIAALMVPPQITLIPNYVFVANLGWVDSYQGIILPGAATAIGTFLLRQHFRTIPKEVVEAARIDGAGHLGLLWQIILPMSKPTLVTFTLLAVVWEWNDYLWPLLVTNSLTMRTLPIGLQYLKNSEGSTDWGVVMAGTMFVVLPVLLLFLWAQRHIVAGIMSGSVKG